MILTEGQLLFRLQDFHGAEQEALGIGDYEFAQESADIACALRELLQARRTIEDLTAVVGQRNGECVRLHSILEAAEKRIAGLEGENEYISKRFKEADLIVGRNLIAMRAAIIEWRATGDAKNGMAWIFNTLLGPGELPSENEKDAQAYFDREDEQLDKEMMELHKWFWERNKRIETERTAGTSKGE
ncbi:ead/Ea22-like family protein [Edwardsiella tarda]|uniref:ead/Ea22-like family protein n=1 Tax=Edwardsiella tarda TaxID=636 RepID=UPI0020A2E89E|nr:ead/Ea22-like family protein [Edwardsiella tarda]